MNASIENLNQWGGNLLQFAWPMLWQSSLLIAFVFALDLALARKIRASVRYALWLAVLVKLLLPPTLALPTGAAWWLFQAKPAPAPVAENYTITYSDVPSSIPDIAPPTVSMPVPPPAKLELTGWLLLGAGVISVGLLLWLAVRWWQVSRLVRRATMTEQFSETLADAMRLAGAPSTSLASSKNHTQHSGIRLKIVEGTMSPAVCGLFRPVILLPRSLAEKLSPAQLRAVLLHEIFHLRRGDVWVNCAQALLQIAYWWHPLLWIANARIRQVREEAVDDAVMLALREEADGYAPTLLEVAKLAFRRPLLSLGLVGIMESRSALRQRIERLVDFRAPRRAGLTLASLCGICVFSAVALPMGEAPAPAEPPVASEQPVMDATNQVEVQVTLRVDPAIFIKNVQAQAAKVMRSSTNDYGIILNQLLHNEGVDLTPPHGLAFNTQTGEITTQNTVAQLNILRQVVEQLNRADGKCELPLRNTTVRKPAVLVEAAIYQMRAAEFEKIVSGLDLNPPGPLGDANWQASPEQFKRLTNQLAASGFQPVMRPRIQTSSGMPAQFFVGDIRHGTEVDCLPLVNQGMIELTLQGGVTTDSRAGSTVTNQFHTQVFLENRGGVVVHMENVGGVAESNVVICLSAQILTNSPVHYQQRLQAIIRREDGAKIETIGKGDARMVLPDNDLFQTRVFKIDTNTFLKNFKAKVPSYDLSGATNLFQAASWAMRFAITNTGVDMKSPPGKAVFFNEHDSLLYVKATPADFAVITPAITNLCPSAAGRFKERLQTIINRSDKTKAGKSSTNELYTRTYLLDKRTFFSSMNQMGIAGAPTNSSADISKMVRSFFANLGVNLDTPKGKTVFFNERNSMLFVKATEADLDFIDRAIQAINQIVPQVHIKVRFIEMPKGAIKAAEGVLGLTNTATVGVVGVTSDPDFRALFHRLVGNGEGGFLGEPEVTTLSGRQAQIRATTVQTIVTNMEFSEKAISQVTTNLHMHKPPTFTTNVTMLGVFAPATSQFDSGPIFDVMPRVSTDGESLELRVQASRPEFWGYAPVPKSMPPQTITNSEGQVLRPPRVWPVASDRVTTTTMTLQDNQTLVLKLPDPTPIQFDVPEIRRDTAVAQHMQAALKERGEREVLVFVTATIVDQAGNRVHAERADSSHFQINAAPDKTVKEWHTE